MIKTTSMAQAGQLLPEPGALREWHRQLAAGERTRLTFDPLFYAACAEMNAAEWTWYPPACNEYRRQAAVIMGMLHPEPIVATMPAPFAKLRPAKIRWSFAQ